MNKRRLSSLIEAAFPRHLIPQIEFGYATDLLPIMYAPKPGWNIRVRPSLGRLIRNNLPDYGPAKGHTTHGST